MDNDNIEIDSVENSSSAVTPWPSRSSSAVTPAPSRTALPPRPTETGLLSSLPGIYYGLAILCGIVLLIVTLVTAMNVGLAEAWLILCYTVGAVVSMLAVGRVIELLEQIRDAVRS